MLVPGLFQACVLLLTIPVSEGLLKELGPYKGLITMIHNYYRGQEKAADMKALTWDPYLQKRAEQWSENCHWGHQSKGLGENLAYYWTSGPDMSNEEIIIRSCQNWWKEVKDWSWSKHCGAACHYTQMIWGNTERIGCSLSKCASMTTTSDKTISNANYFVCFYDPPGNFIGRHPYQMGRGCSQCKTGYQCKKGLCSKNRSARIKT